MEYKKTHIRPGTFWQRKGDLGVAVQPLDSFCETFSFSWVFVMKNFDGFYAFEVAEVL